MNKTGGSFPIGKMFLGQNISGKKNLDLFHQTVVGFSYQIHNYGNGNKIKYILLKDH